MKKELEPQGRWAPPALVEPWVREAGGDADRGPEMQTEDLTSPFTAGVQGWEGKPGRGHKEGSV